LAGIELADAPGEGGAVFAFSHCSSIVFRSAAGPRDLGRLRRTTLSNDGMGA